MKKIFITSLLVGSLLTSGCSDYLDVLPKDQQATDQYWTSSGDVENILAEGYYTMRSLTTTFFDWGELRAGSMTTTLVDGQKLETFQILPSNSLVKWSNFYHIVGMANQVLKYAPGVMGVDESYKEAQMKSHLTEAYFLRAFSYFYLVRNFRDVPLILEPYDTDEQPIYMAKSPEAEIIAQIKKDIETALESGAAKEMFNATTVWANPSKGRATKWALYALMADVCLWNEDYDECITYADLLLHTTSGVRPVFMSDPMQWFSIYYPGNSNESIFEVPFDNNLNQTTGSPTKYTMYSGSMPRFYFSMPMTEKLRSELNAYDGGRTRNTFYYASDSDDTEYSFVWKYSGIDENTMRGSDAQDANFIIYRMADIILMKAEALICKGDASSWQEAVELINQIRRRAGVGEVDPSIEEATEESLLTEYLLPEREMEFAAEGKRWYDMLRFARKHNGRYKQLFMDIITENNVEGNQKWLKSALQNEDAWFLPIAESELTSNKLLVQNPYYGVTN